MGPTKRIIIGIQFLFVAFGATVLLPLLIDIDPAIISVLSVDLFSDILKYLSNTDDLLIDYCLSTPTLRSH